MTETNRAIAMDEWVAKRRAEHEEEGHKATRNFGWCDEPNGITAVWCPDGAFLEALDLAPFKRRKA